MRGGRKEELVFHGYSISVGEDENVLERLVIVVMQQ